MKKVFLLLTVAGCLGLAAVSAFAESLNQPLAAESKYFSVYCDRGVDLYAVLKKLDFEFLVYERNISIPAIGTNNFELKPQLISLIQQNYKFHKLPLKNPHQFLTKFLQICNTIKTNGIDPEIYRLILFPFTVKNRTKI